MIIKGLGKESKSDNFEDIISILRYFEAHNYIHNFKSLKNLYFY